MQSSPIQATPVAHRDALQRITNLAVVFSVLLGILFFSEVYIDRGFVRDLHGYVLGRDFLNFWLAGKIAWMGDVARFYDSSQYTQLLRDTAGTDYWAGALSYPPTMFLIAAPFRFLPYWLGLILWQAGSAYALCRAIRMVGGDRRLLAILLMGPAVLFCLICGQQSMWFAAAIIAALHWRTKRPMLAGILIGLLSVKPQLGILFPIVLIFGGHGRAFVSASVTAFLFNGTALLMYGLPAWEAYLNHQLPEQLRIASYASEQLQLVTCLMPTVFNDIRLAGLSVGASLRVQYGLSALAALLLVRVVCRRPAPPVLLAAFSAASVVATPYLLSYDLVAFSFAMLWLLATQPASRGMTLLWCLAFWLPLLDMLFNRLDLVGPSALPLIVLVTLALGFLPQERYPIADDKA